MKVSVCIFLLLIGTLIFLPVVMPARHISRQHSQKVNPNVYRERRPTLPVRHRRADPVQVAGSTLPDCSHACGSCSPCRLVMVSFVCASLAEAETCPMAYKCMCNNKSYPVP